jgi:hypothetical protein
MLSVEKHNPMNISSGAVGAGQLHAPGAARANTACLLRTVPPPPVI